ncbi:unnamed protein product [Onchocerca ochengi]|uniref:Uncharacterized protein n=2 Tax=Onchocerca TaxID=6281 RepID=A0A8R1TTH0_ONCVO|nr:unnamed protein product [Onchocerca ochengi]VDK75869.1 unnamed protein product [Onchocerca ochengi]
MKKYRSSKPYLKCRLKFDWHIKSHEISSQFLSALAEFLVEKGFKRLGKITRRSREKQSVIKFGTNDGDVSKGNKDMDTMRTNSETAQKSSFALIGMRSVLRNMQKNVLSAVFFDTTTIKPSSVATTLGLCATSLRNTKVYAISGLNTVLSKALNMPMVGAVGLMNISATKELCDLASHLFTSVSILNKQSLLTAATTELQIPTGKKKKR